MTSWMLSPSTTTSSVGISYSDQQTKQQLMKMMRANELNIQEHIMNRRDCNEELRDFFDEKLQGIYSADYNLKFSSQTNDPHVKKEQRMIELIRSATIAGDKDKLKLLQEFGEATMTDSKLNLHQPILRKGS